jgi:hypothetical protein
VAETNRNGNNIPHVRGRDEGEKVRILRVTPAAQRVIEQQRTCDYRPGVNRLRWRQVSRRLIGFIPAPARDAAIDGLAISNAAEQRTRMSKANGDSAHTRQVCGHICLTPCS